MKKEPLLLYFTRLLLTIGILIMMALLYWSSLIIEEKLQITNSELEEIKKEINEIQSDNNKILGTINNLPSEPPLDNSNEKQPKTTKEITYENNLLTPDPFYEKTLPQLLGPNFKPHGKRREGTVGKPDNLQPFTSWAQVVEWNELCIPTLAALKTGIYETYAPSAAVAMVVRKNEKGQDEYWIKLREDLFWAPLKQNHFGDRVVLAPQFLQPHQVTAHDFKFYFDAFMNKGVEESEAVTMRNEYVDVEEFKVIDDFTFTIRWKTHPVQQKDGTTEYKTKYRSKLLTAGLKPLPRFVYQYFANGKKIVEEDSHPDFYRNSPIWAQNFSHHWANNVIVGCGPWIFDGMTDREIKFKRNHDYYNPLAALTSSYSIVFKSTTDGIWEEFKQGTLDLYIIPPYQLADLYNFLRSEPYQLQEKEGNKINSLEYLTRAYTYIGWNEAKPYFKSKKVRQALTMAIDRERIIRQNLNGMGLQTTGAFFPLSPSYDPSIKPYPFDPAKALELLHAEGWFDSTGSGILTKEIDGKQVPFQFTLNYFVKNLNSKAICEYVATSLKEIGIQCIPNGLELADISKIFEDKNFDSLYLAWQLSTPPEDPRQLWYTSGQRGSSNSIGFSNKEVDAIIDALEYEYDENKRIELFHQFDAILHDEAPYTFLYVPKTTLVYRDYLQNVFIPADRQDLIPGANVGEPISNLYWIKEKNRSQESGARSQ
jgi:peptide/nickel transport system substrate-binding protein